jgi:hypothetical protein
LAELLGPVYGGAIVELSNWRWIFWLNVPQGAAMFAALWWLPNQRHRESQVDYLGGTVLVASLVVLSLALSQEGLFTLSSPLPFLIAAPGLLLAVALGVLQRRIQQPLLPSFLFRSWAFLAANITQFLVGVSLIIAMVTVPLMANTVMDKEPFTGALWLLRLTGFIPAGAILGGWLLSVIGIRTVTVAGLLLAALGLFLVSIWPVGIAEPQLTLHLAIAGSGFGLVIAPIATRALNAVSINYQGTAASLVVVARMLGMTLGLAALSAWGVEYFQVLTAGLEFPAPMPGESAEAVKDRLMEYDAELTAAGLSLFHNFFRVAATVSLVAMAPALAMRDVRVREPSSA